MLDCRDTLCIFTKDRSGQRTNGGCRCLQDLDPIKQKEARRYIRDIQSALADTKAKLEKAELALRDYASIHLDAYSILQSILDNKGLNGDDAVRAGYFLLRKPPEWEFSKLLEDA